MPRLALLLAFCVAACAAPPQLTTPAAGDAASRAAARAASDFIAVVRRVEPVAEQECRDRTDAVNCDFLILVDDRRDQPPNAFQTVDRRGRPAIIFTATLIADARNQDELAFILGHEAAHHIAGHLERVEASAELGALVLGQLAQAAGQSRREVSEAVRLGAEVGARRFAKEFELEADRLGTVIAARAGFDPVRGAQFFARIPDPGDEFLGTHPPNAARQQAVLETAQSLRQAGAGG
ncbi:MAG: M48 family metalloprotease [Acidobacteriota bacterium]